MFHRCVIEHVSSKWSDSMKLWLVTYNIIYPHARQYILNGIFTWDCNCLYMEGHPNFEPWTVIWKGKNPCEEIYTWDIHMGLQLPLHGGSPQFWAMNGHLEGEEPLQGNIYLGYSHGTATASTWRVTPILSHERSFGRGRTPARKYILGIFTWDCNCLYMEGHPNFEPWTVIWKGKNPCKEIYTWDIHMWLPNFEPWTVIWKGKNPCEEIYTWDIHMGLQLPLHGGSPQFWAMNGHLEGEEPLRGNIYLGYSHGTATASTWRVTPILSHERSFGRGRTRSLGELRNSIVAITTSKVGWSERSVLSVCPYVLVRNGVITLFKWPYKWVITINEVITLLNLLITGRDPPL